ESSRHSIRPYPSGRRDGSSSRALWTRRELPCRVSSIRNSSPAACRGLPPSSSGGSRLISRRCMAPAPAKSARAWAELGSGVIPPPRECAGEFFRQRGDRASGVGAALGIEGARYVVEYVPRAPALPFSAALGFTFVDEVDRDGLRPLPGGRKRRPGAQFGDRI